MRLRHRLALAAVPLAALVLAASLGQRALGSRIRVDELELLPSGHEVLEVDEEIRQTFGSDERFIIALISRHYEVGNPLFLADLDFFAHQLRESPNVDVLLHDRLGRPRFRADGGEGWVLYPPDPHWIERALESHAIFRQLAASRSHNAAFLELPALSRSGVVSLEERVALAAASLEERRPGEYETRVMGRDVVLHGLGLAIFEDLARLLPWTFVVIFALLLVAFRSFWLALIALVEVGLAVTCTLGVLALLGLDLSIMTALVPVLITVLGIADEIHLFGEFLRLETDRPELSRPARVRAALGHVFFPITATTLTTAIGFGSFLFTGVPALRAFGLLASVGVCFSWLFTVTFVPALLALLPLNGRAGWQEGGALPRSWPLRRPLALAVSLVVIPGIWGLHIDDGWTRNFSPDHPIVQDVDWFQEESVGIYSFDVVLRQREADSWAAPAELRALDELAARLAASPRTTAVISLADLVRDRAWELGNLASPRPPLPASRAEVELWLDTYLSFNEQIFVDTFLSEDGRTTRLRVGSTGDDYATSSRLLEEIHRGIDEVFGASVEARIGGGAERGRVLIETIVASQGRSVLALLLMAWLTLGSGRWGTALVCVLVIAWALAVVLGIAGYSGLDLGVASSCFLALGMGVGLDYAIHLAFAGTGKRHRGLVERRVLANVVVVGAGLGALLLSSNPTIVELGALLVLGMVACGYAVLVFFGAETRPGF